MSTHSNIAVEHTDGSVSVVYCHSDGYIEYNGKMLVEHYNSKEKAEDLVSFGAISTLQQEIYPTGEHSFANRQEGVTVFYTRDRGEEIDIDQFDSVEEFVNRKSMREEFNYIFTEGDDKNGNRVVGWFVFVNKSNHYSYVKDLLDSGK
jgi:hypothetical protein